MGDVRLRALYLVALAVGVFFLPLWAVALVLGLQVVLWFVVGYGVGAFLRQVRKLFLFLAAIIVAYSLVENQPGHDVWYKLSLGWFTLDVNYTGFLDGLTMVLRVLAVVLASQIIRAGDPRALAAGLRKLGAPQVVSMSVDTVLTLLGSDGGRGRGRGRGDGSGGGGGGGGGRSTKNAQTSEAGFWASLKRLARGDMSVISDSLVRNVDRAEAHVSSLPQENSRTSAAKREALVRDVAVISGIALTMLAIKALKLLPGLPFAPGHKGVVLIPLYVVAGFMSRSRFGATLTGLVMGSVAFLLGDGRYGLFEIAKHVAPGLVVDLLMPLIRRTHARRPLVWSSFGLVIALGRFATVTVIALAVQAPAVVYAFLIPGLIIHALFGVLSGLITAPLVHGLRAKEAERFQSSTHGHSHDHPQDHPREAA